MPEDRCFCGQVRYDVADDFSYAANCHCSNCRRTTGSAFKPFAGIERDKFRLYSLVRAGAYIHVAMGTLVDTPSIHPTAHIFVGSKAKWFTITDDLPQYYEHVPG